MTSRRRRLMAPGHRAALVRAPAPSRVHSANKSQCLSQAAAAVARFRLRKSSRTDVECTCNFIIYRITQDKNLKTTVNKQAACARTRGVFCVCVCVRFNTKTRSPYISQIAFDDYICLLMRSLIEFTLLIPDSSNHDCYRFDR